MPHAHPRALMSLCLAACLYATAAAAATDTVGQEFKTHEYTPEETQRLQDVANLIANHATTIQ